MKTEEKLKSSLEIEREGGVEIVHVHTCRIIIITMMMITI